MIKNLNPNPTPNDEGNVFTRLSEFRNTIAQLFSRQETERMGPAPGSGGTHGGESDPPDPHAGETEETGPTGHGSREVIPAKVAFLTSSALMKPIDGIVAAMDKRLSTYDGCRLTVMVWKPALEELAAHMHDTQLPAAVRDARGSVVRTLLALKKEGRMIPFKEADTEWEAIRNMLVRFPFETRKRIVVLSQELSLQGYLWRNGAYVSVLDFGQNASLYTAKNSRWRSGVFESASPTERNANFPQVCSETALPLPAMKEGDELGAKRAGFSVSLLKECCSGAEGRVFTTTDERGRLAKIVNRTSDNWMQKILIMSGKFMRLQQGYPSLMQRIAWPEQVLVSADGTVRGYLMRSFTDGYIPLSSIGQDNYEKLAYDKRDAVNIALQCAELVAFLHDMGLTIGDLSVENFLVKKIGEHRWTVALLDLDSCTIVHNEQRFGWKGGRIENLAPERAASDSGSGYLFDFCREKADDDFALANLIFHLCIMFTSPYAATTLGGDLRSAIKEGRYPYQFGETRAGDVVLGKGGPLHCSLSWTPYKLKEAWFSTFSAMGKRFLPPVKRITAAEWCNILGISCADLEKIGESDCEAFRMFPTRMRVYRKDSVSDDDLNDLLA